MMLNADVHKGGDGGLVKCGHLRTGGGGMKKGHFLQTSFMDDPFAVILGPIKYLIFLNN